MSNTNFSYILGPCSAESEEQMLQAAKIIQDLQAFKGDAHIEAFRAGVWKPRTRPNGFEGHGEKALQWLNSVQKEYDFKVMTEVANAHHVELCLKYKIDYLWIGARTTTNPFSVQEIADALQGVDIPVFIKNPLTPDLALWLGAIERIKSAGIKDIRLIHRGFNLYHSHPYRNAPIWEIPVEIKRLHPEIPIFCDPSHISGRSDLIPEICQNAINLEMDGVMIEVHPDPANALSDAKQQLDFEQSLHLLKNLIFKQTKTCTKQLQEWRNLIDDIDEEMLRLLKKRIDLTDTMGKYKREHNLSVLQKDRWAEMVQHRLLSAKNKGLEPTFILEILKTIHAESLRRQTLESN